MVNNVFVAREDLFTASGAGAEYSRLFVVGKICVSATYVLESSISLAYHQRRAALRRRVAGILYIDRQGTSSS